MTKRDLFRLLIKLSGLFFLITVVFSPLPNNFALLISNADFVSILIFLATTILLTGIFVLLIFKPDTIINLLQLDKGFDDDNVNAQNLSTDKIFLLAIIIIGGSLLIKNIPLLISNCIFAFKTSVRKDLYPTPDNRLFIQIGVNIVNLIIGYFMIAYRENLCNLLSNKRR